MGCDIHLWVEVFDGNQWQFAHTFSDRNGIVSWDEPYTARDSSLFALLAGVRADGTFPPIAPPRGVPHDVSTTGARIVRVFGNDGHTHSWLLLSELIEHNRTARILRYGYLSLKDAELWREFKSEPQKWADAPSEEFSRHSSWTTCFANIWPEFYNIFVNKSPYKEPPDSIRLCFFFDN
jgi:hypothetical protein